MKRVFLIVLDSCGVGYEPDAAEFGDVGANTLHTCSQSPKFAMPNLISMGLGNLDGVDYLPMVVSLPRESSCSLASAACGRSVFGR